MAGNNGKPEVLDLDRIRPEARYVRLNGQQIDVSHVPFEVFLDIAGNLDKLAALGAIDETGALQGNGSADYRGALELLRRAAVDVLAASPDHPDQADIDGLDTFQMFDLILFVVRPFFAKVNESKNLLATGLSG